MEQYGVRTFSDLRDYVAEHPGEVSVAMQSAVGVDGMCFEIATKGLALNRVAYESGSGVNRDLAEGRVDLAVGGYDDMSGLIDTGDVVPLLLFCEHPAGYYDAILMDVRMPVMNGLEATRAIGALDRPDAKEIPIIAMTANAFDEDVQTSLQAGMDAHLSKPVEPERLYETLERMIRRG